jgi:hypothetical protein
VSENVSDTQPGEWQRECEECGTALQQVQVQFTESELSIDGKEGTPVVRDVCPNPDCPRHQREYAEIPSGTDDRPGSLGGDNGGA